MKLANRFHVGKESNLPTRFSPFQFTLLGLVCGTILVLKRYLYPKNKLSLRWAGCAVGAIFLSVDESALVHGTFGTVLGQYLGSAESPDSGGFLKSLKSYY